MSRIEELARLIIETSEAYYNDGNEEIDDLEFDSMVVELASLQPDHLVLTQVGWGAKVKNGVPHPIKLVALKAKYKTIAECQSRVNGPVTVMPKYDGSSAFAYYENGKLSKVLTRGDGMTGSDITKNVLHCVPATSEFEALRGELIISWENFNDAFADTKYKHPRNACVGLVGADTPNQDFLKYVEFIPYQGYVNGQWLAICENAEYGELDQDLIQSVQSTHCDNYPCDGYVISPSKNSSDSFALKLPGLRYSTTVLRIEWNTQKTGKLFPTIMLDPVTTQGYTNSRVTGNSAYFIQSMKCGVGATIELIRSGDVIPKIMKAVVPSQDLGNPKCSYGCHESFLNRSGAHYYCTNEDCGRHSRVVARIIDHFSHKGCPSLVVNLLAARFDDLNDFLSRIDTDESLTDRNCYALMTPNREAHLLKLLNNIRKFKIHPASMFNVLGIEGVGWSAVIDMIKSIPRESDLKSGILEKRAYVVNAMNRSARGRFLKKFELVELMLTKFELEYEIPAPPSNLPKVCITGKLDGFTKSAFNDEVKKRGYQQVDYVDKTVSYLIINESRGSSKEKKAQSCNVPMITQSEFLAM